MHPTGDSSASDVLLADGTVAVIRPLAPRDLPAVEELHARASDESLRMRFFSAGRGQARVYVDHLRESASTTTLVAELGGVIVGIVTAERVSDGTEEAAFLVDDEVAGRGLGSLLLEHLAASARSREVRHLTAEVLMENRQMLRVFTDAGFDVVRRIEGGVMLLDLDPRATDVFLTAADGREARSEARSLAPLLHPASVAVVGVRRDGTGVGAAVVRSIRADGFRGRIVVLHPSAHTIEGVPAVSSLEAVAEPVDLVVVTVPAEAAVDAVEEAATAGVRAAVVISSGFEELGDRGRELQHEMVSVARRHSMRLVGPNCLGLLVNDPDHPLNATFHLAVPPSGGLAVASQSGGVGLVLLDVARRQGLGVGVFVSLGDKADVSGNDLISAWRDDPTVTAAALYLESFGNARKFARLAREFSERKPLLVVVGGRSTTGGRAGESRPGALAASAVGVEALVAHAGVISCDSAEELAETALVLAEQPRPGGVRMGILSNASGLGLLAADAADGCGMTVPRLSPELSSELAGLLRTTVGTTNPVDVGAAVEAEVLAGATRALLVTDEVDAVLVVLVATALADSHGAVEALVRMRREHPAKPLLVVPLGGIAVPDPGAPGITCLGSALAATRVLARIARYEAWRSAPHESATRSSPDAVRTVRQTARRLLAELDETWLDPDDAATLLGPYGLAPVGRVVEDPDEIRSFVDAGDGPVVVKVADPRVVHKSDRGLVRVGLGSGNEAVAAAVEFAHVLGLDTVPVLVQPVLEGVELAIGLLRDPVFGPLVMVAAGGAATDVLDDRIFLMPPVTARDAVRAVRGLRGWPLLEGHRGQPPVDRRAIEEVVMALGRLALEVPEVAELDLNPVLARADGVALVDVKVRLVHSTDAQEATLRALRAVR
jgi:acyl-CoA synthetase (NDP forming)/L-amino acid N-acyltransferase YncA